VGVLSWFLSHKYVVYFHNPRAYNSSNHYQNPINIFGGAREQNVIAIPAEKNVSDLALVQVQDATDFFEEGDGEEEPCATVPPPADHSPRVVTSLLDWPEIAVPAAKVPPNLDTPIAIEGAIKRSIFVGAPTTVAFKNVKLESGSSLLVSLGIHPEVWTLTDGAVFEIQVSDRKGVTTVLSRHIDPGHVTTDRRWTEVTVDLARFGSGPVDLLFVANLGPSGKDLGAWCLWAEPRIICE
jgi:hypothetical protein